MPQLDVSTYPSLIFWALLSFSFLYVFLSWGLLPRVRKTLKTRQDHVDTMHKQEQDLLGQIEAIEKKMEAELAKFRAEAHARVVEAENTLQQVMDDKYKSWKKTIEKKEQKLTQQLEKERQLEMGAFKEKLPDLSRDMYTKITGSDFSKKDVTTVVDAIFKAEKAERHSQGGGIN